jgi:hypothetical protein
MDTMAPVEELKQAASIARSLEDGSEHVKEERDQDEQHQLEECHIPDEAI